MVFLFSGFANKSLQYAFITVFTLFSCRKYILLLRHYYIKSYAITLNKPREFKQITRFLFRTVTNKR